MREPERDRLLREIKEDRVTALLSDLVALPSPNPPGEEGRVADYVAEVLETAGCRVSKTEVLPGRPNVVARCGTVGTRFLFNTHTDVVPAGSWDRGDPFRPLVEDGFLYGRGAADAKGSLAAMIAAVEVLSKRGASLGGEIILCAVVDEEGKSSGTKALGCDLSGDLGVVGEPTSLRVMTAHRGSLRCVIAVLGKSCHSASPSRGVNAIYEAVPVIERLRTLAARLAGQKAGRCGTPTLALTRIEAGVSDNMLPDRCRILVDRRLVPGESQESALREIQDTLDELRQERPGLEVRMERTLETTGGPAQTDETVPVVRIASEAVRRITGREPRLGGLSVACDMVHLASAGTPTVVLGPGDIDLAHTPSERVPLRELHQAAQIYAWMALHALSQGPPVVSNHADKGQGLRRSNETSAGR